uniref:Neurotransmitter-gated ion-channel ligand-binding domain-containing protein n=1 Tax=Panagrolaimus superbus TaxID=310955 RepID=A0A914YKS0_9BILA
MTNQKVRVNFFRNEKGKWLSVLNLRASFSVPDTVDVESRPAADVDFDQDVDDNDITIINITPLPMLKTLETPQSQKIVHLPTPTFSEASTLKPSYNYPVSAEQEIITEKSKTQSFFTSVSQTEASTTTSILLEKERTTTEAAIDYPINDMIPGIMNLGLLIIPHKLRHRGHHATTSTTAPTTIMPPPKNEEDDQILITDNFIATTSGYHLIDGPVDDEDYAIEGSTFDFTETTEDQKEFPTTTITSLSVSTEVSINETSSMQSEITEPPDKDVEEADDYVFNADYNYDDFNSTLNETMETDILNKTEMIDNDIPLNVKVKLNLIHLANFDSEQMEYTIDLEMEMRWFDIRLANNYSKPIRIREKQILDMVFRPDPYFVNSKYSYFHMVTFPNFRMRIMPTGLIIYTMRVTLLPSCSMTFCRFPHDSQECDLLISSIAYPQSFVNLMWHDEPIQFSSRISLPELKIKRMSTEDCIVEGKLIASSCLRLVFNLERDGARYIVEKYIPSTLAMMFAWVAPYVPYNYEDVRIITPITVLLTLVQMEKGDIKVRTSYLTSMDQWFAAMKAFSVLSLVESLIVLALIKRSRAMVLSLYFEKIY